MGKASADVGSAENSKNNTLPKILQKFLAADIYNADKTSLFYQATLDGSVCHKYINYQAQKHGLCHCVLLYKYVQ